MNADVLAVLIPAAIALAGVVLRSRVGSANHWDVLHELARGRVAAGLERERRATMQMVLVARRESVVPADGMESRRKVRRAAGRGATTSESQSR